MNIDRVIDVSLVAGVLALGVAIGLPNDTSTSSVPIPHVFGIVGTLGVFIGVIAIIVKFMPAPK